MAIRTILSSTFVIPSQLFTRGKEYVFSCVHINRTDEQKQPKILAITVDYQQSILAGIRQFLVADLDTCLRDVRSNLASAQAVIILNRGNPFSRLKMEYLHAWMAKLKQEMEEQQQLRREIEESIRSSMWWRNAFNAAFTVVTVGVILGSVVLAAYVKVHVGVIAGTVTVTVMKTVELWINSIWEQRNDGLKEKKMAVEKKQGTLQVLSSYYHLEILPSLVEKVQINYSALEEYFLHQDIGNDYDEEAVERKVDELKAGMDLLLKTAHKCIPKIRRAEAELSFINNKIMREILPTELLATSV